MKKHIHLLTILFLSISAAGQVNIKSYSLGLGINQSIIFPSGNYDLEEQGFQPKISGAVCFATGVDNLEIQAKTSIDKLNYSRPYHYPSEYPAISRLPLAEQVMTTATIYGIDFGLKYRVFQKGNWTFSTLGTVGIVKSWNFRTTSIYLKNQDYNYSNTGNLSALNLGISGRIEYHWSEKYSIGMDLGVNQYYNENLTSINRYLRIPTPNNFQLILSRKINN